MGRTEAIKKVRQMSLPKETLEILETLIPELKESEDERIRKAIVDHFRQSEKEFPGLTIGGYYYSHVFAFLEKFKDFQFDYPGIYFYDGEKLHFQGNPAMEQKEQKPAEWNPNNEDVVLFNKAVTTNTNLTPSERAKLDIIRMKFKHCDGNITKPTEWSEEDEKTISEIEFAVMQMKSERQDTKNKCLSWLKSLRPQSHWKPSEEQMNILDKVYHYLWADRNATADMQDGLGDFIDELKEL